MSIASLDILSGKEYNYIYEKGVIARANECNVTTKMMRKSDMKKIIIGAVILCLAVLLFSFSAFAMFGKPDPLENSVRFPMTDFAIKTVKGKPNNITRDEECASLTFTYFDEIICDHYAEIEYRLVKGGIFYGLVDVTYTFSAADGEDTARLFDTLTEELQAKYRDKENYFAEKSEDGKENRFGLDFGATSLDITVTLKEGPVKVYVSYLS